MKILNAGQNYRIKGGSDRYLLSLGDLLTCRGHEVIPFAAHHCENLPSSFENFFPADVNFDKSGVFDLLRYLYNRDAADRLRKLLAKQRIDIAHLHIFYGKLSASIIAPLRERNIPIIQTLHEYRLVCPAYKLYRGDSVCEECQGSKFYKAVLHRCNRKSLSRSLMSVLEIYLSRALGYPLKVDHFITVSDFMRNKLSELGVPEERMTTVHNFIDCSHVVPDHNSGRYLLYFGRLEKVKGLMTLLQAMRLLPECRLVVAGDGPLREDMHAFIERYQMQNVEMAGFCQGDKLVELIKNSFCTVLPSEWYEGFPMAILESFAYGKPVIGSDIGGISEAISHGQDGLLFPVGNVGKLSSSVEQLALHLDEAAAMGRKGRVKVLDHYNQDVHYRKIMDVYKEVLARR